MLIKDSSANFELFHQQLLTIYFSASLSNRIIPEQMQKYNCDLFIVKVKLMHQCRGSTGHRMSSFLEFATFVRHRSAYLIYNWMSSANM